MKNLTFSFLVAQLGLILFFWKKLPPEVPLFYSRPWGKEQLASPWFLFLLPGLTLFVFLVNFAFLTLVKIRLEKKNNNFLIKIIETANFTFSLFCLITLVKIILLIT
jgi:hypothetical protein